MMQCILRILVKLTCKEIQIETITKTWQIRLISRLHSKLLLVFELEIIQQ